MPITAHNKHKDVFPTFKSVGTLRGRTRLVFFYQETKNESGRRQPRRLSGPIRRKYWPCWDCSTSWQHLIQVCCIGQLEIALTKYFTDILIDESHFQFFNLLLTPKTLYLIKPLNSLMSSSRILLSLKTTAKFQL